MKNKKNRYLWFTLVEMLIVVVIIWILAAALIPRLVWAQSQARDSARKVWMWQLGVGFSQAFNQDWIIPLPSCADKELSERTASWATYKDWSPIIVWRKIWDFVSDIPQDPQKNHINYWVWISWTVGYWRNPTWTCVWTYVIRDAYKNGKQWQWYIISSNLENRKNWNYVISWSHINYEDDIITWHQARICDKVSLVSTTPTNNCQTNQVNSWVYVVIGY